MRNRMLSTAGCALLAAMMPTLAAAQSDWHSNDQQAMFHPSASEDLSMHPGWMVQRYESGHSTWIVVRGRAGEHNLTIRNVDGRMDSYVGSDSISVSTASSPLLVPADAKAELIYADSELSLILYTSGSTLVWSIESDVTKSQ